MIGDIIDYCFGGASCNIAEGFVREHVAWYALQLVHNDEYLLIARENPPHGQSSTNRCCYLRDYGTEVEHQKIDWNLSDYLSRLILIQTIARYVQRS